LVGERLRAARVAQGLTLDDIASSTRIPKRHLQTIEEGRYDGLPAPTYSTGFIKSWARQLGLDGRALAEEFRSELGVLSTERTQTLPYEPADPRRTPPAGLALLALLVAVVVGLGYLYWRGTAEKPAEIAATASDQTAAPASAPAQTGPAAPAQVTPAPTPQPTGPVVIGATGDVWIKVSDGGKTLFMNMLHPGDHFEVPADATAPLLTTGRPGETTITVGQTQIPPVGAPDRAAKDISLKPADLLARMTAAPSAAQPPIGTPTPVENSAGT
jgi:cytoskeletal protein RodZ